MSVSVRGKVPSGWNDQTARHITERLQALERALAGGAQTFVAPAIPSFGSGTVPGGGGGSGGGSGSGVTDHGALTGLGDDDHPQYQQHVDVPLRPHQHTTADLVGVEHEFARKAEAFRPHVHPPDEFDPHFYRRGERVRPEAHQHVLGVDVTGAQDENVVLSMRMFGG